MSGIYRIWNEVTHPTGLMRVRHGWFGRLIPQVQERTDYLNPRTGQQMHSVYTWRDAKESDFDGSIFRQLDGSEVDQIRKDAPGP